MTIYSSLGVRTLVNARGNATLAGGTLMAPEVIDAMTQAARSFVRIGDLQDAASRQIADLTGAEAGYVTTGAAAALTLGAAAMLTGLDPDRMDQLPETGDGPNEIVVQHTHRNPYDHLVRASGARLVEFGDDAGATASQMTAGIGPATAGAFFYGQAEATGLPFHVFAATAHAAGLPVLVDASMSLPPRSNLRRFIAEGADLVAFSGGKTVGGPQASGFLAGRRDLLISVGLQQQDMDVLPATWARRSLLETGTSDAAASARHRAIDEDRQGGDRGPDGGPQPVCRTRRGRGGPTLDDAHSTDGRRARQDRRASPPMPNRHRMTAGRSR